MPNDNGPLGRVYTLAEAADHLKIGRVSLARAARKIGAGVQDGRKLLFRDADLEAVWESMRVRPTEPYLKRPVGPSPARQAEELRRLLAKPSRK